MTKTPLDSQLLAAYRNTRYRVFLEDRHLDLIIDESNPGADRLLDSHGVSSAAFLTAWNPRSKQLGRGENDKRQQQLITRLSEMGFDFLHGEGQALDGNWPQEASLLILGLTEAQATGLAKQYRQNGYVFVEREHAPRLVLA